MSPRILITLFTLSLLGGANGDFVAPDLQRPLFQRDRVPLDPDRMRALANQLTQLAAVESGESAIHLRARAQLLAVATRLDPASPAARTLTRTLEQGHKPPKPAANELKAAESMVWQTVRWLQQKEAGAEGRHLGALLLDALRVLQPNHPAVDRHDTAGEEARWNQVVAPLEQFSAPPPPEDPTPAPVEDSAQNTPEPPPPAPEPWSPPIAVRENTLRTPLFVFGPQYRLKSKVVPLRLNINQSEQAGPLTYGLSPSFNAPVLDRAREETNLALLSIWPRLPEQNFAILSTDDKRYAQRNGTTIAGPAALLLHASLSGKTLRENLTFLGKVNSDGTLQAPANSWHYLSALRQGPGGRLLVPPDLKDQFRALIVLEDPGFFLKYEVLVVSSLETALAVGSPNEDPEGLASVSATFAEIQKAGQGRNTGQLVAIESVRERLGAIHTAAPYHLSAEMLLLQSSGSDRPAFLSNEILTRELRRALEPMKSTVNSTNETLTTERAMDAWTACRKEIDGLQRFVDFDDRGLFKEAYDLINELRTLSRELKKDRKDDELPPAARRLFKEIQGKHREFLIKAAETTGEPPPAKKAEPTD